jgi:DNA processing protein
VNRFSQGIGWMQLGMKYSSYSLEELLGPLNEVERKYAPKRLFVSGELPIPLPSPRSAIIGSRKASPEGLKAAKFIAKTLVKKNVTIVSGLAEGIDTSAHETAIEDGGYTIAILGTPLDKVYPKKNASLQEIIMRQHLAISQFPTGYPIQRKNFVIRNRLMALISDASIIVEAGNSSGSLHQGWEALRLGRPLFIWHSILENSEVVWPKKMLQYGAMTLTDPEEVMEVLPTNERIITVTP